MHERQRYSVLCWGELLWDRYPDGDRLGGAPINVAYHLASQGIEVIPVSAVGEDAWGDRAIETLADKGLSTKFIRRHADRPTGMVKVAFNAGEPSYTIATDVAWDAIGPSVSMDAWGAVDAIVYGSLAQREDENFVSLKRLLKSFSGFRCMDINLRAPFDDLERISRMIEWADLVKMNADEARRLLETQEALNWREADHWMAGLGERFPGKILCVTGGASGAVLQLRDGSCARSATPVPVSVVDTVGAGDAFMARLVVEALKGALEANPVEVLDRCCQLGGWVATRAGAMPEYDATAPVFNS